MDRKLFSVLFLIVLLSSCKTPQNVAYFQGLESLTIEQKALMDHTHHPKICVDDVLIINVASPDRETAMPYNPPPYSYYKPGESEIGISAETQNLYTYLVDEEGFIGFPVLGRILLAGLTINEANRKIEDLLKEELPGGLVNIQIVNFKIRVIGEVARPNEYSIKSNRVSILDMIAMAGDLTIFGDRQSVWVFRDDNGKKEQVRMDLTDPAIFASPYYYLQQNDIVYVVPNKSQKKNSLYSNEHNFRLSVFSALIASIASVTGVIISIINVSRD